MSRDCKDAHAMIQVHLDGELSEWQRGILNAHVANCPGCAAELAAASLAASALSRLPAPVLASDFAAAVTARVAAIRTERHRLWHRVAWFTALLGGAVAATLSTAWAVFLAPAWDAAAVITKLFPTLIDAVSDVAMVMGRGLLPIGTALARVSWPGISTLATYYGAALAILLFIVIATARDRRLTKIPVLAF